MQTVISCAAIIWPATFHWNKSNHMIGTCLCHITVECNVTWSPLQPLRSESCNAFPSKTMGKECLMVQSSCVGVRSIGWLQPKWLQRKLDVTQLTDDGYTNKILHLQRFCLARCGYVTESADLQLIESQCNFYQLKRCTTLYKYNTEILACSKDVFSLALPYSLIFWDYI